LPAPPAQAAAAALVRSGGEDLPPTQCPPQPIRREEVRAGEVILTVEGCLAASEPRRLGGLPEDMAVDFEVPAGAGALLALVHLRGAGPLRAWLVDPDRQPGAEHRDNGTAAKDALARLEVAQPRPGPWRVEAAVDDLVLAKPWKVTVVRS
jgi:hypothetical protein